MNAPSSRFSVQHRAAEKAAARARDESDMQSGAVAPAKMARINGGKARGVRRIGPSARLRQLAAS